MTSRVPGFTQVGRIHSPHRCQPWQSVLARLVVMLLFVGSGPTSQPVSAMTLRLAVVQTHPRVHEAYDQVARAYEALHPGIRIVQISVPERLYTAWLTTQLIGGTAPEIVEALGARPNDEQAARSFVALTHEMRQPNPYNQGTLLERLPWRDTFVDGLNEFPAFRAVLMDVYGVSSTIVTHRLLYNRPLLERVTGSPEPPRTMTELLRLVPLVEAFNAEQPQRVVGIAAARETGRPLLDGILTTQTQRLALETDPISTLRPYVRNQIVGLYRGDWTLDDESVRRGLNLVREASRLFQPGFEQARSDDALFYFLQGRALALVTSSIVAEGVKTGVRFPVVVGTWPWPDNDPIGKYTVGPVAELTSGAKVLHLLRTETGLQAQALDFLRFLTSLPGQTRFVQSCELLPAVLEVPVQSVMTPFQPLPGVMPYPGLHPTPAALPLCDYLWNKCLDGLTGPTGSVEKFLDRLKPEITGVVRLEIDRAQRDTRVNAARQDATLAALEILERRQPSRREKRSKFDELLEYQTQRETISAYWKASLAIPPPP